MNPIKPTITYKVVEGTGIQADFYKAPLQDAPVLVYIHGGGLIFGSRSEISSEKVSFFIEAGYSVLSIDYRLAPETKLKAIVEDIQDALKYVQNINRDFVIVGGSAGGYLALLMGTLSLKPKAIVSLYGYGDLLADWAEKQSAHYKAKTLVDQSDALQVVGSRNAIVTEGKINRFLFYLRCRQQGTWIEEITGMDTIRDREEIGAYCPARHVSADFPPTLLIHGDHDKDVPYQQSLLMSESLTQAGVYNERIIIPQADHLFDKTLKDLLVMEVYKKIIQFLSEKRMS
ncbi:alpha/beta hydrolase [Paenibacillus sp.]|uniref:alpha/beta hydrolase n=1 Tax=Paenibacillus sp. TaxID=58172 RepID=UPI0028AE5F50|nr:alpha/beta hydrolase [Paenibacillus sp.]